MPLAPRVKDEFEFEDDDRMKGDELDALVGDMFSRMELLSAVEKGDGASFGVKDATCAANDELDGMVFKDDTGDAQISLPKMFPFVAAMWPLFIELFGSEGRKVDTGNVP